MKVGTVMVFAFASMSTSLSTIAYEPDWEWEKAQIEKIDRIPTNPSSDELLILARLASNEVENPHVSKVKALAWERLSFIPEFPELFLHRLQDERKKWEAGKQTSSVYYTERLRTIQPMGGLRHPGIVNVLGKLLYDLERPSEGAEECGTISVNGVLAANSLGKLLDNKPVPEKDHASLADVETWQLWYEQVKAGNRTFRFKGDPQEYNLQGPVSSALVPVERTPVSSGTPHGASGRTQSEGRSVSVVALIASSVVLGLAAVFLLRGRRRKPA